MHTYSLPRFTKLPVIREVLGAGSGMAIALSAYYVFEFARDLIGVGASNAIGERLHGAAAMVMAQGTVGLALPCTLALAAGCAFVHRRMMSEID